MRLMKVKDLIEHLKMFGEEIEVYIQTIPSDFALPMARENINLFSSFLMKNMGYKEKN